MCSGMETTRDLKFDMAYPQAQSQRNSHPSIFRRHNPVELGFLSVFPPLGHQPLDRSENKILWLRGAKCEINGTAKILKTWI
jgi:hypothetical protein